MGFLRETQTVQFQSMIYCPYTSVSPSPKKGHGKVAKKGHSQRAAVRQKGTFSARRQAKGHLFK